MKFQLSLVGKEHFVVISHIQLCVISLIALKRPKTPHSIRPVRSISESLKREMLETGCLACQGLKGDEAEYLMVFYTQHTFP